MRWICFVQVRKLLKSVTEEEFERGSRIIEQGDFADCFFVLKRGTAVASIEYMYTSRLGTANGHGSRINSTVVKHYNRGEFFGELGILRLQPRAASIIVTSLKGATCLRVVPVDAKQLLGACRDPRVVRLPCGHSNRQHADNTTDWVCRPLHRGPTASRSQRASPSIGNPLSKTHLEAEHPLHVPKAFSCTFDRDLLRPGFEYAGVRSQAFRSAARATR